MAVTRKRNGPKDIVRQFVVKLSDFNTIFQNVEGGVEHALKTAQKQGQKYVGDIKNLASNTLQSFQDLEVLEYAKLSLNDTKRQLLSALQIPSTEDLNDLSKKVSVLEKKLSSLKRHELRQ